MRCWRCPPFGFRCVENLVFRPPGLLFRVVVRIVHGRRRERPCQSKRRRCRPACPANRGQSPCQCSRKLGVHRVLRGYLRGFRRTSLRTSFKPSSISESNQLAHSTQTSKYQLARRNTRNNPLAALAFLPVAGLSQPAEKKRSSRMSWHGFLLFLPPAGNCRSFAFYLENYIAYVVLYSIPRGAWPRLVAQLILPVSFNVVDPGLCACR